MQICTNRLTPTSPEAHKRHTIDLRHYSMHHQDS